MFGEHSFNAVLRGTVCFVYIFILARYCGKPCIINSTGHSSNSQLVYSKAVQASQAESLISSFLFPYIHRQQVLYNINLFVLFMLVETLLVLRFVIIAFSNDLNVSICPCVSEFESLQVPKIHFKNNMIAKCFMTHSNLTLNRNQFEFI